MCEESSTGRKTPSYYARTASRVPIVPRLRRVFPDVARVRPSFGSTRLHVLLRRDAHIRETRAASQQRALVSCLQSLVSRLVIMMRLVLPLRMLPLRALRRIALLRGLQRARTRLV